VKVQQPWIVLRTGRAWQLFDAATEKLGPVKYDSVFFRGPFVVGVLHDTLRVHIQKRTKDFLQPVQIEFIPGQDSLAFMVVTDPKQKTIYNQVGKKLFTFTSDRIQHAGHDCFIVTKKEKKGLASGSGKLLLPQEYDAVGTIKDDNLTLLKGMKFGVYNYRKKKLIKPEYTKNVMPYNADVLAAFKGGYWGFIGWDNKPLSDFEFSEVKYWSDSLALVKKNSSWMMYNIRKKRVSLDRIRRYTLIRETPDEKLAIIQQDNRFGVLSSKHGTIIPINFSDIVNVGSADEPLYFTEKHVEEASLFVVIYYSAAGKFIRKEVYEQDDYERIYCSQK
jgi:hypothetical protein